MSRCQQLLAKPSVTTCYIICVTAELFAVGHYKNVCDRLWFEHKTRINHGASHSDMFKCR